MIENVHKRLEQGAACRRAAPAPRCRRRMVEVGPPLFFSLLIITICASCRCSRCEAQEGRLFAPLAYTKTYAMAAAAGLSVTLVPVLIVYLVRGRIREEKANPLNRVLIRAYRAVIDAALRRPRATLAGRRAAGRHEFVAVVAARLRIHAAARRGRSALHADHAAGSFRRQGAATAAADRPADQDRARGRRACSARSARPKPPPIRRR